jgi:hypothetical protein
MIRRATKPIGIPEDRTGQDDRWISRAAAATVVGLAGIAGAISYSHMRQLAQEHGQPGWHAHAFPLSVDGIEIVASLVLLADRRAGRRPGWLPWLCLSLSSSCRACSTAVPRSVLSLLCAGRRDLGTALAAGGDVTASLRPFLALRILGVIPLRQMTGPHAVACLAKLAELSRAGMTLAGWCACTSPGPRTCRRATRSRADSANCRGESRPHGRSRPDEGTPMTDRVRAALITPDNRLLTIRRVRPGQEPYSVLPGAASKPAKTGVRAGEIEVLPVGVLLEDEQEAVDVGRWRRFPRGVPWPGRCPARPADRSGPKFNDPTRGTYHLQPIQLTTQALSAVNLKPDPLAQFLISHISAGDDLFALPDLRANHNTPPSSP